MLEIDRDDLRRQLETRIGALELRLAELEKPVPGLPRPFLLEAEYMAALVRAQIEWLRAVAGDLRSGRLTWSKEWLRRVAAEWASEAGPNSRPDRRRARSSGRRRHRTHVATRSRRRRGRKV